MSSSPWLYGLTGALQGIQYGMQYNQQQKAQDLASQFKTLQMLYEQGDEQVKTLAAQGLAEMAQKGDKYKGDHLNQIRALMMPAVMGPPSDLFGDAPGGGASGSPVTTAAIGQPPPQAPAPGSAAPPPAGITPSTVIPASVTPPGASGGMPSAALPSTSITAQTGSTAGQPPGPPKVQAAAHPVFSAGSPEELGQNAAAVAKGAGINRPEPPDEAAIAATTAKPFGFTPEQISQPGFTTPGHLRNPERERIRADYQRNLGTATTTAGSEYRAQLADYTRSVMGYVTQVGAAGRTATLEAGRESRLATSEEGKNTRVAARGTTPKESPDDKETRLTERSARAEWSKEIAAAEASARKLKMGTSMMTQMQLKKDPGLPERMVAEARAAADARFRQITGKEPPGAAVAAGESTPVPGKGTAAPAAAKPPASPLVKTSPAAYSPPPQAPITPADQRRASQIRAKANRSGLEAITTEERSFMKDYQARGGQ